MQVRAKETGFYKGSRRRAGTVFDLAPGDEPGGWMEKVVARPKIELAAEDASPPVPQTFSEITKVTEKEREARAKRKGIPTEVLDAETGKV